MNLTQRLPYQKTANHRGSALETRKYGWMKLNCTCIVTGNPSFEIAHVGGYAEGKSMARKSNLDTLLPLQRALHFHEERDRAGFWLGVGLRDYLKIARKLHGYFERGEDPQWFLEEHQSRVDREYVELILEGVGF